MAVVVLTLGVLAAVGTFQRGQDAVVGEPVALERPREPTAL
jgi:hypothetical protein